MTVPSSIPTVLGSLAIFTTSALVAVDAILAYELTDPASSSTSIIAIVSAGIEGAVLVSLSTHVFLYMRRRRGSSSPVTPEKQLASSRSRPSRHGLWFGLSIFLCSAASAVSAAALASLGRSARSPSHSILGNSAVPFLAGAAVTLGVTFAAQLIFLIVHYIATRSAVAIGGQLTTPETGRFGGAAAELAGRSNRNGSSSVINNNADTSIHSPSSSVRIKSVPYSKTSGSSASTTKEQTSPDTMYSIRSTFSHVIHPITSKTRLIPSSPIGHSDSSPSIGGTSSQRSSTWRPDSLAGSSLSPASTYASREYDVRPSIDDFDSWDTSGVDPQNLVTVLESFMPPSSIASRFLETIPASPSTSRSSRSSTNSHSPAEGSMRSVSGTRLRSKSHSNFPPPGEAHIHPLFRSDSPTPPPAVSAGTVVTAAPLNVAQMTVTDAQSLRTLSRMRSGSLPAVPSPLSRQGSFDDFGPRRGLGGSSPSERPHTGYGSARLRESNTEEDEADRRSRADSSAERKMTPPIPEWVMSAGSHTSLSGYQGRRVRIQDGAI
ncbi:MAG: hypothetical protein STHCBS139747_001613 [Sporothrix thermara]